MHYCRRCYGPLPRGEKTCERCGFVNFDLLCKKYWSLEPKLVSLERTLKLLVVLLSVAAVFLFAYLRYRTFGHWVSIGLTLPILPGVALWWTASKLTQKRIYFGAARFWIIVLLLFFALALYYVPPWAAAGFLLPVYPIWAAGKWVDEWKERKIASGPIAVPLKRRRTAAADADAPALPPEDPPENPPEDPPESPPENQPADPPEA